MRYQVSLECSYWHEAAVVDTMKLWLTGVHEIVCECGEIEDAHRIALALNRAEMLESGGAA